MVTTNHRTHHSPTSRVLIVGNYCHDVLIQDDIVLGESLGGASSFIAAVLNGLSVPCNLISKVGNDFKYQVSHTPIVISSSKTTTFHAYFDSPGVVHENGNQDRVLKRVCASDPITPRDLPDGKFNFGMAVGVGGEILSETLERMIEICDVVLVDIQALIRDFDHVDGTVKLVELSKTRFYSLLPRIGVLKVSSEEAMFMDVEEVRKCCCVVVTNGEDGCKVYWRDGEMGILPFLANQQDPTGAGDSFLGGFVAGLVQGLAVPDAALLGNFFGSLTVEQIGLPKFDSRLLQRVKDEVEKRKLQCLNHERSDGELEFLKPEGHEQFHSSIDAAKLISPDSIQESRDMEEDILPACNGNLN
ncbi:kinase, putative [Ricinus communis]|uniref:Kinase, putative n=1 Tax=Ricinus communis TaxID=3988 RepID=B9SI23_RICCO|nr:kinase, putative [Ricinus communis]|eukprot:XP_002525642.1 inositol 3-kinase [Ricinus communis]